MTTVRFKLFSMFIGGNDTVMNVAVSHEDV